MTDLKTRLSALLIQYRYTRSRNVLNEMVGIVERMDDQGDHRVFEDFFLNFS